MIDDNSSCINNSLCIRGYVENESLLPLADNTPGDCYHLKYNSDVVMWNGYSWLSLTQPNPDVIITKQVRHSPIRKDG